MSRVDMKAILADPKARAEMTRRAAAFIVAVLEGERKPTEEEVLGMVTIRHLAERYAMDARNGQGERYEWRYRDQLERWWLAGFRQEKGWYAETNYQAPLRRAYNAGQQVGREVT